MLNETLEHVKTQMGTACLQNLGVSTYNAAASALLDSCANFDTCTEHGANWGLTWTPPMHDPSPAVAQRYEEYQMCARMAVSGTGGVEIMIRDAAGNRVAETDFTAAQAAEKKARSDELRFLLTTYSKWAACSGESDGSNAKEDGMLPCFDDNVGCGAGCCRLINGLSVSMFANGLHGDAAKKMPVAELMARVTDVRNELNDMDAFGLASGTSSVASCQAVMEDKGLQDPSFQACIDDQCSKCTLNDPARIQARRELLRNKRMNTCASSIHDYCASRPGDAGCAAGACPFVPCKLSEDCPCEPQGSCARVYDAPFPQRAACENYRAALMRAYVEQGFHQPASSWRRSELRRHNSLSDRPTAAFVEPSEVAALRAGCALADDIAQCAPRVVEHCNAERDPSPACRSLARCGDGVVSWGERCDEGAQQVGCERCEYVQQGFSCGGPGRPCTECALEEPDWSKTPPALGCPFCGNHENTPCAAPACRKAIFEDWQEAKACDDAVAKYCGILAANRALNDADQGDREDYDPGCANYRPIHKNFATPEVAGGACSYEIVDVPLNSADVQSIKHAVVECAFKDQTSADPTFAPPIMAKYWSPIREFSESDLESMNPGNRTRIREMDQLKLDPADGSYRQAMVPLSTLTLHELDAYADTTIRGEHHSPLLEPHRYMYRERVARLRFGGAPAGMGLEFSAPREPHSCRSNMVREQERLAHGSLEEVRYDRAWVDGKQLNMLPPTVDPAQKLLDVVARRARWDAVVHGDHGLREFRDLDASKLPQPAPADARVQFFIELSRTRMECPPGGGCETRVPRERINHDGCLRWGTAPGKDGAAAGGAPHDGEAPCEVSVESALRDGFATIGFGNMLYASGCADEKCMYQVAPCQDLPVVARKPEPTRAAFEAVTEQIKGAIDMMEAATTTATILEADLKVASLVVSRAYADAFQIYEDLSVFGPTTRALRDVENYCPHHWGTDAWNGDPCCNWNLREFMCCAKQDVAITVTAVVGIADPGLQQAMCPRAVRENKDVTVMLEDIQSLLKNAEAAAGKLAAAASMDHFDDVWRFEEACRQKIEMREGAGNDAEECSNDADCYCSHSVCDIDASTRTGRCRTDKKQEYKCFAECFQKEYGAQSPASGAAGSALTDAEKDAAEGKRIMLDELMKQWGTDGAGFTAAWGDRMTEEGCAGPWAHQEDVGHAGYEWVCDAACEADNGLCWEHDAMHRFSEAFAREQERTTGRHRWPDLHQQGGCQLYHHLRDHTKRDSACPHVSEADCRGDMACTWTGGACSAANTHTQAVCDAAATEEACRAAGDGNGQTCHFVLGCGSPGIGGTWTCEAGCDPSTGWCHCWCEGVDFSAVPGATATAATPHPLACSDADKCRRQCHTECRDQALCELPASQGGKGGTFIPWDHCRDDPAQPGCGGDCCPAGAHVIREPDRPDGSPGHAWCSLASEEERELEHQIHNQDCCEAAGGKWRPPQDEHDRGSCCFGRLRTDSDGRSHCEHHVEMWKACSECEVTRCAGLDDACTECLAGKEQCCAGQYVSQDRQACEAYRGCNDNSVNHQIVDWARAQCCLDKTGQTAPAGASRETLREWLDRGWMGAEARTCMHQPHGAYEECAHHTIERAMAKDWARVVPADVEDRMCKSDDGWCARCWDGGAQCHKEGRAAECVWDLSGLMDQSASADDARRDCCAAYKAANFGTGQGQAEGCQVCVPSGFDEDAYHHNWWQMREAAAEGGLCIRWNGHELHDCRPGTCWDHVRADPDLSEHECHRRMNQDGYTDGRYVTCEGALIADDRAECAPQLDMSWLHAEQRSDIEANVAQLLGCRVHTISSAPVAAVGVQTAQLGAAVPKGSEVRQGADGCAPGDGCAVGTLLHALDASAEMPWDGHRDLRQSRLLCQAVNAPPPSPAGQPACSCSDIVNSDASNCDAEMHHADEWGNQNHLGRIHEYCPIACGRATDIYVRVTSGAFRHAHEAAVSFPAHGLSLALNHAHSAESLCYNGCRHDWQMNESGHHCNPQAVRDAEGAQLCSSLSNGVGVYGEPGDGGHYHHRRHTCVLTLGAGASAAQCHTHAPPELGAGADWNEALAGVERPAHVLQESRVERGCYVRMDHPRVAAWATAHAAAPDDYYPSWMRHHDRDDGDNEHICAGNVSRFHKGKNTCPAPDAGAQAGEVPDRYGLADVVCQGVGLAAGCTCAEIAALQIAPQSTSSGPRDVCTVDFHTMRNEGAWFGSCDGASGASRDACEGAGGQWSEYHGNWGGSRIQEHCPYTCCQDPGVGTDEWAGAGAYEVHDSSWTHDADGTPVTVHHGHCCKEHVHEHTWEQFADGEYDPLLFGGAGGCRMHDSDLCPAADGADPEWRYCDHRADCNHAWMDGTNAFRGQCDAGADLATAAECAAAGGRFVGGGIRVDVHSWFRPGRFETRDQCEAGECQNFLLPGPAGGGGPFRQIRAGRHQWIDAWQGWSKAQCEGDGDAPSLSPSTCSRECQKCRPDREEYRALNGACFSDDGSGTAASPNWVALPSDQQPASKDDCPKVTVTVAASTCTLAPTFTVEACEFVGAACATAADEAGCGALGAGCVYVSGLCQNHYSADDCASVLDATAAGVTGGRDECEAAGLGGGLTCAYTAAQNMCDAGADEVACNGIDGCGWSASSASCDEEFTQADCDGADISDDATGQANCAAVGTVAAWPAGQGTRPACTYVAGERTETVAADQRWFECPVSLRPNVDGWQSCDYWHLRHHGSGGTVGGLPERVNEHLRCRWHGEACLSAAECEAMGECDDRWENTQRVCLDADWPAECAGTDWCDVADSTGAWSHRSCNRREEIQGVCVSPIRPHGGCGRHWLWHRLGCRQLGPNGEVIATRAACETGVGDRMWLEPSADKAACEEQKACFVNRHGWSEATSFGAEDCAECEGTQAPVFHWRGPSYGPPSTVPMTWQGKKEVTAVNEWVKVQASYKMSAELEGPIIRAFAASKGNELRSRYVATSAVIGELLEYCGSGADTSGAAGDDDPDKVETKGAEVNKQKNRCQSGNPQTLDTHDVFGKITVVCDDLSATPSGRRLTAQPPPAACAADATIKVSVKMPTHYNGARKMSLPGTGQCGDRKAKDTLVLTNDVGAVIGQLIGDGAQVSVPAGCASAVRFCMDVDPTIRKWSSWMGLDDGGASHYFPTVAVAKEQVDDQADSLRVDASVRITSESAQKVCVETAGGGTYFPVLTAEPAHRGQACALDCGAHGVCAVTSGGAEQCVCHCGFHGAACGEGCPHDCNADAGQGTCEVGSDGQHRCSCVFPYEGESCNAIVCPSGPDGQMCSRKGTCGMDKQCKCNADRYGPACEKEKQAVASDDQEKAKAAYASGYSGKTAATRARGGAGGATTVVSAGLGGLFGGLQPAKRVTKKLAQVSMDIDSSVQVKQLPAGEKLEMIRAAKAAVKQRMPAGTADKIVVKTVLAMKEDVTVDVDSDVALTQAQVDVIVQKFDELRCGDEEACTVIAKAGGGGGRRRLGQSVPMEVLYELQDDEATGTVVDTSTSGGGIALGDNNAVLKSYLNTALATEGLSVTDIPAPVVTASLSTTVEPSDDALVAELDLQEMQQVQQTASDPTTLGAVVDQVVQQTSLDASQVAEANVDVCNDCSGHGTCTAGVCTCSSADWTGVFCSDTPCRGVWGSCSLQGTECLKSWTVTVEAAGAGAECTENGQTLQTGALTSCDASECQSSTTGGTNNSGLCANVTCSSSACTVPGTCNPSTGQCSPESDRPDGTSCNSSGTCTNGQCSVQATTPLCTHIEGFHVNALPCICGTDNAGANVVCDGANTHCDRHAADPSLRCTNVFGGSANSGSQLQALRLSLLALVVVATAIITLQLQD